MSHDTITFNSDCNHLLRQMPQLDMTIQYCCIHCGGVRDVTHDALQRLLTRDEIAARMLADLGGTIGEPLPPIELPDDEPSGPDAQLTHTTLKHLAVADIAFVEFLDAWVDKGIADGTLTIAAAAAYREAIAARCAELGEVPGIRQHLIRIDLKSGDMLAIIAPSDSMELAHALARSTRRALDDAGHTDVQLGAFLPGTKFHIFRNAAPSDEPRRTSWQDNVIDDWVRRGVRTREQAVEALRRDGLL